MILILHFLELLISSGVSCRLFLLLFTSDNTVVLCSPQSNNYSQTWAFVETEKGVWHGDGKSDRRRTLFWEVHYGDLENSFCELR